MSEEKINLQLITERVNQESQRLGLKINVAKTKAMAVGKGKENLKITVESKEVEQVSEFVYLGGLVTEDGTCKADIKRRIGLTHVAFNKLQKIWNNKNLSQDIKHRVYNTLVVPVLLYGSECWTMRKQEERSLLVAEMCWIRRILGISRHQKPINEEIRKRFSAEETIVSKIG